MFDKKHGFGEPQLAVIELSCADFRSEIFEHFRKISQFHSDKLFARMCQ